MKRAVYHQQHGAPVILKMASLLTLGLSLPILYFTPQNLESLIQRLLPVFFFSSARDYYLFMVILMGLPAGLGGLLAGWLWRWKGILLVSLHLASVIATAGIEAYRWGSGIPAALDVPLRYVQVLQWGMGDTAVSVLAVLVGAAAVSISMGTKRRLHSRTSGTR